MTGEPESRNLSAMLLKDEITPRIGGFHSSLRVWNVRNSINLPIVFPDDLDTLAQFREWLIGFMAACTVDYFDKVERMKHTSHRTIKYFNGDIFRFEIDLEHMDSA